MHHRTTLTSFRRWACVNRPRTPHACQWCQEPTDALPINDSPGAPILCLDCFLATRKAQTP